jgi:hypothetical protein
VTDAGSDESPQVADDGGIEGEPVDASFVHVGDLDEAICTIVHSPRQ